MHSNNRTAVNVPRVRAHLVDVLLDRQVLGAAAIHGLELVSFRLWVYRLAQACCKVFALRKKLW